MPMFGDNAFYYHYLWAKTQAFIFFFIFILATFYNCVICESKIKSLEIWKQLGKLFFYIKSLQGPIEKMLTFKIFNIYKIGVVIKYIFF